MPFKKTPRFEDEEFLRYVNSPNVNGVADRHAKAVERAKKNKEVAEKDVHEVLGSKDIAAKYKIEVLFGPNRTTLGPNSCVVQFWESGRRLHGGGDDLMFMCKNRQNLKEGCGKLFSSDLVTGPLAHCPACGKVICAELCVRNLVFKDEHAAGGSDYRVTTTDLSNLLANYWRKLGGNADIYLKYDKTDAIYQAMVKQLGSKKAHELRGLGIYPLAHILSDTASGASLEGRIYASLVA